jgi:hypothetical protein
MFSVFNGSSDRGKKRFVDPRRRSSRLVSLPPSRLLDTDTAHTTDRSNLLALWRTISGMIGPRNLSNSGEFFSAGATSNTRPIFVPSSDIGRMTDEVHSPVELILPARKIWGNLADRADSACRRATRIVKDCHEGLSLKAVH